MSRSDLIQAILNLKGSKIVTLHSGEDQFVFDIHDNGEIGYSEDHAEAFHHLLSDQMEEGGVIVRQFLPMTYEVLGANQKKMRHPYKNLYGFFISGESVSSLSPEELETACNTDANTGDPLPPEKGVFYRQITFNSSIK
ncbi:MAG: hypothetical protein ACO3A2_02185 [Bdellovibrionia bacterium]